MLIKKIKTSISLIWHFSWKKIAFCICIFYSFSSSIYSQSSGDGGLPFITNFTWYGAWWAYLLYLILGVGSIYTFIRWRTSNLKERSLALEREVADRTKEIKERVEELSVINGVQRGLVEKMDIDSIYTLVGDQLCDLFDADTLVIRTFDTNTEKEIFNYAVEKGERLEIKDRPFDAFARHLIDSKEPILIRAGFKEFIQQFSEEEMLEGEMPKSAIFSPMIVNNEIMGNVSLQNVDHENAFNENDVRLLGTLTNSMSIALENARLFDQSKQLLSDAEQRAEELAVINSVQKGLVEKLDLNSIYALVGEKIKNVFNSQVVVINIFDHENKLTYYKYAYEKGEVFNIEPVPTDAIKQKIIDTGKHILINKDFAKELLAMGIPISTKGEDPKSALWVPLISGEKVIGCVSLQNVDHEDAFSENDVKLMGTLVNSMAVALDNARLFNESQNLVVETQRQNNELAVINSIQEGLVAQMEIEGIYELVGAEIGKIFDAQVVSIATYDYENNLCHFKYDIEKGERFYEKPRKFNMVDKQLIETRQPIFVSDNLIEKFNLTAAEGTEIPLSAMWVPLVIRDKVNGHVSLQNIDKENAFSLPDQSLLLTLANSMSIALENARLFDTANRLLKDAEQRAEELVVINSVQEGLVKQVGIQEIFEFVGSSLQNIVDAQSIIISSFDHDNSTENFNYATRGGEPFKIEPRQYDDFTRHIISVRKPLVINNNFEEYIKNYIEEETIWEYPKSAIFMPITRGADVVGNVSLQNLNKENAYSESEVRLLETLVNSISVALDNARLFEETKLRAAELSTVNSVSQAIANKLELGQLIELVGDNMRELFNAHIVYVALLDKPTGTINFPYGYGDDFPPLKMGEGLCSAIMLSKESQLINEDVDSKYEELGIENIGAASASYLGVPIPVMDEVIGVISVQSALKSNRFNESDQHLLETIASNVGVAIQNAQLFEEAKNSRALAEEANEAKSSFLSTVSHELRTPLTSVLGFAKIIKKRLENRIFPEIKSEDPRIQKTIKQVSENLNVVVSEGERLTKLINDVLDLAKIEAGKIDWYMDEIFIHEVLERAIAATSTLFEGKEIHLTKEIDDSIPSFIGDSDKLIQVAINLLSNAVKFTDEGTVHCHARQMNHEILISVIDSGIGISKNDLPKVFEKFKQVGDTLTDKPKGTGLGLPISVEIVEHHGGKIWVESEVGKGSTFTFSLPLSNGKDSSKEIDKLDIISQ